VLTNSLPMTKQIMLDGLGLGFFTPTGFVDEVKSGELVHVPLAEPDLAGSEIGLLLHRERQSSPAVQALAARLIDEFAELERDFGEMVEPKRRTG
jgi:DNA-binding transcriptional LysR family regulator